MSEIVIRLQDVHKAFAGKPVLRGVELEVARGETLAVLGSSGSGKSVTLKTVNGLLRPDRGSVEALGVRVDTLSEKRLQPLRQRVSYLFQGGALFDSMTVFDNIAFPLREHRRPTHDELHRRVAELLALVQLDGTEDQMPSELSGGMRKRAALARALALDPEVIMYDEPTTGLDPVTGSAIAALIRRLDERFNVTSVVVTHDVPLVRRVAQRIVFLHEGRFVFSGTVAEATAQTAPEVVRTFFSAGGSDA